MRASNGQPAAAASYPSPDTIEYARLVGVSFEEAQHRLALQDVIGELGARLERQPSFGGLYIEHVPEYRVFVQVSGETADVVRSMVQVDELAPLITVIEVRWS